MKKRNQRVTTRLMLASTVGASVVGVLTPLANGYAVSADDWTTSGFKDFPYADIVTLQGTKLDQFNLPLVAWTNASKLTGGKVDSMMTPPTLAKHYPMFSEAMTANDLPVYCINPFRLGPTKDEQQKGHDTHSTPRKVMDTTLYRAACNVYPAVHDVDRDGKNDTILDRITSIYTIWLAKGLSNSNYGENLNTGIKWDDIKDNFSNDKGVLGQNFGWNLSLYKTLNASDQAKVKKSIYDNLQRVMKDKREPHKPEMEMKQTVKTDAKGNTVATYTPSLKYGFSKVDRMKLSITGVKTSDVKVVQNGKEVKPKGVKYELENSLKPFTVTIKPQPKGVKVNVELNGYCIDAIKADTFDAKDALVQNSLQADPQTVSVSATLKTDVKQSVGSLKLHKIDDENKPLEGVEFGLYKDKDCKQKVATGKTDAKGDLTFDKLAFGDYYLKELKTDDDHSNKFKVTKVTINSVDPNVQFTDKGSIVNDKKNIDIKTILSMGEGNVVDASKQKATDAVELTHLRKDATYRITDEMFEQESKKAIDGAKVVGNIKVDKSGKVTSESKDIEVVSGNSSRVELKVKNMSVNLEGLGNKKVVANVKVERMDGDKVIDKANEKSNTELNDPSQSATVVTPSITTDAQGNYQAKVINPYEKTKITDKTKATQLVKGMKYNAKLQLVVIGEDGKSEPVKDKDGKAITASKEFTAKGDTETMDVSFPEFDSTKYAGKKFGIIYTLTDGDRDGDGKEETLAEHNKDLKDQNEIVEVTKPTLETKALINGLKEDNVNKKSHVVDVVSVKGLAPNQPVTLSAVAGDEKGNLLTYVSKGKNYNLMNKVDVDLKQENNNYAIQNTSKDGKVDIQVGVPLRQVEAKSDKATNIAKDAKARQEVNNLEATNIAKYATETPKDTLVDTNGLANKTVTLYEDLASVDENKKETTIASHPTEGDAKGKEEQSFKVNKGNISTVALVDMEGLKEGEQTEESKDDADKGEKPSTDASKDETQSSSQEQTDESKGDEATEPSKDESTDESKGDEATKPSTDESKDETDKDEATKPSTDESKDETDKGDATKPSEDAPKARGVEEGKEETAKPEDTSKEETDASKDEETTKPSEDTSKEETNKDESSKDEAKGEENKDASKDENKDTSKEDKAKFTSVEEIQKLYGGRKITNPTGHKRVADVLQYNNFTPGITVDVSAMAMDSKTGQPIIVKDKEGKDCYLQGRLTFTPKSSSGRVVVPLQQVRVGDAKDKFSKETMGADIVKANRLPYGEAPTLTKEEMNIKDITKVPLTPTKDEEDGATSAVIGENGEKQVYDAETGKPMDRVVKKDGTVREGTLVDQPTADESGKEETDAPKDEEATKPSTDESKDETNKDEATEPSKDEATDESKEEADAPKDEEATKPSTDESKDESKDENKDVSKEESSEVGTVDLSQLRGKTFTIFESVTAVTERETPEYTISEEVNKDNKDQQIRVTNPKIQTIQYGNGQKAILRGEKVQYTDTVKYEDVAPNEELQLQAVDLDAKTKKPFKTKDGKYLVGVKTFKPTTSNGEETVNFEPREALPSEDMLKSSFDKDGKANPMGVGADAKKQTLPETSKDENKDASKEENKGNEATKPSTDESKDTSKEENTNASKDENKDTSKDEATKPSTDEVKDTSKEENAPKAREVAEKPNDGKGEAGKEDGTTKPSDGKEEGDKGETGKPSEKPEDSKGDATKPSEDKPEDGKGDEATKPSEDKPSTDESKDETDKGDATKPSEDKPSDNNKGDEATDPSTDESKGDEATDPSTDESTDESKGDEATDPSKDESNKDESADETDKGEKPSTDESKDESNKDEADKDASKDEPKGEASKSGDTKGAQVDTSNVPNEGLTALEKLVSPEDQTPLAEHNIDGTDKNQTVIAEENPKKLAEEIQKQQMQEQQQAQKQSQSQNQTQGQNGAQSGSNAPVAPLAKTGNEGKVSDNWFYRLMDRIFHFGK